MAIGFYLCWWYVDFLPDATLLFSDIGILPRAAAIGGLLRPYRFSLMDAVGAPWAVQLFLLLGMATAFLFMIGYRTRFVAIANFLMVMSVQERNILVLDGSDTAFRVLCFWLIFCPIERAWSVDSLVAAARGTPLSRIAGVFPIRILQLEIGMVYLLNYWNKSYGSHWQDGTALHYAIHLEDFLVRDLGTAVADWRWFTWIGTYGTLIWELAFFFLVFSPVLQPYLRALGLSAGFGFHAGIAALMRVGWFSYLMPTTYLVFFDATWIERPLAWLRYRLGPPSRALFFDGHSQVSKGAAVLLGSADLFGRLGAVDIRDAAAMEPHQDLKRRHLTNQVHLLAGSRVFEGFDALLAAASVSPALAIPALLLRTPGLKQLGAAIWANALAGSRTHLQPIAEGASGEPKPVLPAPLAATLTWAGRGALFTVFFFSMWNALPPDVRERHRCPAVAVNLLDFAGLWQGWDMFSPNPLDWEGHLKIVGTLTNQQEVDLLSLGYGQGGFNPTRPYYDGWYYSRWMKVAERISNNNWLDFRLEYGRSICRQYNSARKQGEPMLATFKIYWVERPIQPPGVPPVEWNEVLIWDHHCF
jgi:hypothetical protein